MLHIVENASELLPLTLVAASLGLLLHAGRRYALAAFAGWRLVLVGFGLVLFGRLVDATAEFANLSRFVVIGSTPLKAFLEGGVGTIGGLVLIFAGFSRFLPLMGELREARRQIQEKNTALEAQAAARTQALRESERRYRLLAENASDTIICIGPDGRRTYISPAAHSLLGFAPDERLGAAQDDAAPLQQRGPGLGREGGQQDVGRSVEGKHGAETRGPRRGSGAGSRCLANIPLLIVAKYS